MTLAVVVIGGVLLWLVKQVLGPLIGQQVKGSIPEYTADKARAAARLLPPEIAEEYEQAWVAELKGPRLKNKPLSALKFALGLRRAARRIRAKAARPPFRLAQFARSTINARIPAAIPAVISRLGLQAQRLKTVLVALTMGVITSLVPIIWAVISQSSFLSSSVLVPLVGGVLAGAWLSVRVGRKPRPPKNTD